LQKESVAIGVFNKCRTVNGDRMRYQRSAHDRVILIEEHTRKKIEMSAAKIPNGGQLPGIVVPRDAAALDLVADSIGTDGVNVRMRISCLFPAKRFAEEIFGEVSVGLFALRVMSRARSSSPSLAWRARS
jgi:hypothetical protein